VYSASWDGNPYKLYSTQAESPESRDLGVQRAHLLAVSPSDELAILIAPSLSFVSATLASVPLAGGTPREIANGIGMGDWGPGGKRLAVVRSVGGHQQLEFPAGNVLYQTTGGIVSPRVSTKEDMIAFVEQPLVAGAGTGWVATVDLKGNKKNLTELWLGIINGLAWSPSGDEILFTAAPYSITTSLYAVNRSGRQRLVSHLPGDFAITDVAPDGRVLLVSQINSNMILYLPTADSKATDLYWHDFSTIAETSRDGKSLLLWEAGDATRTGEDFVTYLRGTDGSGAVRLGPGVPLALSPDGKWALALGSTRPPSQLVLQPTGVGEARPITHDAIHHQGAAWTPDGKRIVFVGSEPKHRIRYYLENLDGSPPRAITPEKVSFIFLLDTVVISPDGRFVAAATLDGKILLYPLDGGAPREVPKLTEGAAPLRWCPDDSLMIYPSIDVPQKIVRVNVDTGQQTLWKALEPADRTGLGGISAVRIGANCQSVAYTAQYAPSELWIATGLR